MIHYPPKKQMLPHGLRILCVKWGDKYSDDYVLKLKAACERHIPHREFLCLTDAPVDGVLCNPLPTDLPGWWSKIGLFCPGMFPGDNLYLDLDVVVTGSIAPLIAQFLISPERLWTLDDFSYSLQSPRMNIDAQTEKLLGGYGTVNSSVMLWRGKAGSAVYKIYREFNPMRMTILHGDQNWITHCLWPEHIGLLPSGIAESYKYGGGKKAPIVVFHGVPKPADVDTAWVKENWVV